MYGYIYLTTNKINNKKYIGQHRSSNFNPKYLGSGILLKEAIQKYGKENFTCEILSECESEQELNEKEIYYIKFYDAVSDNLYYNIAKGGLGHTATPWNKGKYGVYVPTEKQLKALEFGRHLPASDKQKERLSKRRKGIQVSEQTRQKLREAGKKAKLTEDGRRRKSEAMKGTNNPNFGGLKEETKAKISAKLKNKIHIHKGTENKNIDKEFLEDFLNSGWELGYFYKKK